MPDNKHSRNPFDLPTGEYVPPAKQSHIRRRNQFEAMRPHGSKQAAKQSFRKVENNKSEEREHLHTVNDIYIFLQEYLASWRRKLAEQKNEPGIVSKIKSYISEIEKACTGEYSCDPFKYEPILLELLNEEKVKNSNPQKINELRGLIRAGSWMTYERMKPAAIIGLVNKLKILETEARSFWLKQADPDTYKELSQDLKETLNDLEEVNLSLRQNKTGQDLEAYARIIENLNARIWIALREFMNLHHLEPNSLRSQTLTKPLIEEIEIIRPIRDLIYLRRIYPKWAAASFQQTF